MTRLFYVLLLLAFSFGFSHAQMREVVHLNRADTLTEYYIVFKPIGVPIKGLLVLLPSFGETPEIASKETAIQEEAAANGFITAFVTLQYGNISFCIDSISQATLDKMIDHLMKKYNTQDKPFYMGGFSIGGAGVVKYAERAYASVKLPKPKAIFAIDPPLDFERVYYSLEQEIRENKSPVGVQEATYFIQRLQYEFRCTPYQNKTAYHLLSPYSHSDTTQQNIHPLIGCPVRLVIEPDITWQMENRGRSLYDINSLDCSALITTLKIKGNKNAELIITSEKGYRKLTGKRNPHAWSIADKKETMNWLLKFH